MSWLVYIIAGLFSGVAAGMGMGGGTILIPALTLIMGIGQHQAQGVNMLAFIPAALLALRVHKKAGRLNIKECIPMILAGGAGALIGAVAAGFISGEWLRRVYGGFLVALAVYQLVRGEKQAKAEGKIDKK